MKQESSSVTGPMEQTVKESRRKFLKTAGKLAIYTPPAILVLMQPSGATFDNSAIGNQPVQQKKQKVISIIGKFLQALFGRA